MLFTSPTSCSDRAPLYLHVAVFGVLILLATMPGTLRAADAVPGEEFCDAFIDRITFSGNKKTRDIVLLEQLDFSAGDRCSLDPVVDGIQSIMDLRLFRSVAASFTRQAGVTTLDYQVVEKIYFLPIPRFSRTSDGELRYGGQLRWDNFRGRNHRLKLTAERREEDDGSGPGGDHYEIEYDILRFFGSDTGVSADFVYQRKLRQLELDGVEYGTADSNDSRVRLLLSRWVNQGGVTQGLRYTFGLRIQRRDQQLLSGTMGPFVDGLDVGLGIGVIKRDVRDELFRLNGYEWGARFELSSNVFGSGFDYNRTDVFFRRYMPLRGLSLRNLNYQLRLGFSNDGPFGTRLYSLGGGENHRSREKRSKTGDVLVLANIEYLAGWPGNQALRWVLFSDIGNVYRHNAINLLNQKFGVGAGIRWKLLSFSNTDLRLDAAWDHRERSFRYFFSTNLTF